MGSLVFGEILWDIYPNAEYIGGAPLNFAAHLSKLGQNVALITGVGDDVLGDKALKIIKSFGIDTKFCFKHPFKETGKCVVNFDQNNSPSYIIMQDVAYDYIKTNISNSNFELLYFGTLALRSENNRNEVIKLIKNNKFSEIFVDINIRPPFFEDETINLALSNATIVKISAEELMVVANSCGIDFDGEYNSFALKLSNKFKNLKLVLITLGEEGSICFDVKNEAFYKAPIEKVKVASTVGAGDSFSAGFVSKYLNGCDITDCLKFAAKISAFVVSCSETVPDYDIQTLI